MKKNLTELKRLGEFAEFFIDMTYDGLVVELCDLIMEILEEGELKELTLMCDSDDCQINGTRIMVNNTDGENDIWYQSPDDGVPFELREEDVDYVLAIFQHVIYFVRNWDGSESDKIIFK